MPSQRYLLIFAVLLTILLSGCYNQPVRHLVSDASLIRVGSTTRNEVLTYLGEPDRQRTFSDDSEEWLYLEEIPSTMQRTPVVGGYFSSKGRERLHILLVNDVVTSCQIRVYDKDEFDWADDSYREENKE